jgi:hypothetical protein
LFAPGLSGGEFVDHFNFSIPMAASTETNDVIKRMCELRIIEGPYRYNMVDIRLVTDLFTGDATVLARVIVPFQSFPPYLSPSTIVRVFSVFPLVG